MVFHCHSPFRCSRGAFRHTASNAAGQHCQGRLHFQSPIRRKSCISASHGSGGGSTAGQQIRYEEPFKSLEDYGGKVFTERNKQYVRILSIDGGGVKGVMPATIIEHLEGQLIYEVRQWLHELKLKCGDRNEIFKQQETSRPKGWETASLLSRGKFVDLVEPLVDPSLKPQRSAETCDEPHYDEPEFYLRIPDFFDVLAGTSSGGITAAFLATPVAEPQEKGKPRKPKLLRRAAEVKRLYTEAAEKIFSSKLRRRRDDRLPLFKTLLYDGATLDSLLQDKLGKETTLLEMAKPCIFPSFDLDLQQPIIWEGGIPRDTKWRSKSTLLWQVCRATAAPPTYLLPGKIDIAPECPNRGQQSAHQYVDGGLFANDPLNYAHRWVFANVDVPGRSRRKKSMLEEDFHYHPKQVSALSDLVLSLGTGYVVPVEASPKTDCWAPVDWVQTIINAALKGSGQAVHYGMYYPFAAGRSMPAYLRLNPLINQELDRLDGSDNIPELLKIVTKFLQTGSALDNVPNFLATDPFGRKIEPPESRTQLKDLLTRSYFTGTECPHQTYRSLDKHRQDLLDEIFKETTAKTLARFAHLLVREWVFRVRLGARKNACYNAFIAGPWKPK